MWLQNRLLNFKIETSYIGYHISVDFFSPDEAIFCYAYQDLQKGLDLGLVSPEVLQNFFDLEQYPLLKELAHRFQVYLFCK